MNNYTHSVYTDPQACSAWFEDLCPAVAGRHNNTTNDYAAWAMASGMGDDSSVLLAEVLHNTVFV